MGLHFSREEKRLIGSESLQIGDVVLFVEKVGKQPFVTKCLGWTSYSFAAFVCKVTDRGGLVLCGHFPTSSQPTQHALEEMSVADALGSGRYDAVYARQLFRQLDSAQAAAVLQFCKAVLQQSRDAKLDTVAVTMSLPSPVSSVMSYACTGGHKIDRFMTSRLIADMLVSAGCVKSVSKASYVAITPGETVLKRTVPLAQTVSNPATKLLS